jgi:site-specific DNA recombinase
LTNEIHTGTFVWGKNSKRGLEPVRAENACPAIVDMETFLQVQSLMKERMPARIHPRRIASPFLLSGIVYCGYCGKALVGRYAKGGKFSYYVCGTLDKKGAGSCPSCYLRTEKCEAMVIEQIKKHILTPENLRELVETVNRELDSTMESYQTELDTISRVVNDTNQRLGRLYDAIETGKIGLDDIVDRIRELRKHQELLQARRIEIEMQMSDRKVELVDLNVMTNYIKNMQGVLREGTLAERRAFIRSFVQEIKVKGNEALMTYPPRYCPKWYLSVGIWFHVLYTMVGGRGFEPLTSAMSTRRSNQLS